MPSEINIVVYRGSAQLHGRTQKSLRNRLGVVKRRRARMTPTPPSRDEFRNASCYVDPRTETDKLWTPEICQAFVCLQLRNPGELTSARFCFVARPMPDISETVQWNVALNGGWLLAPGVLVDQACYSIYYKRATLTWRSLWVSPSFQTESAQLWRVIEAACNARGSRWSLLATVEDFVAMRHRRRNNPATCLALISEEEASNPAYRLPHVHRKHSLFKFIAKRDLAYGPLGPLSPLQS